MTNNLIEFFLTKTETILKY